MKHLTLLILIAALSSCNLAQRGFNTAHTFAKNNCVASAIQYDPKKGLYTAHYECSGLWTWREGRKHIVSGELCVETIDGKVSATVVYDSTSKVANLYKK